MTLGKETDWKAGFPRRAGRLPNSQAALSKETAREAGLSSREKRGPEEPGDPRKEDSPGIRTV